MADDHDSRRGLRIALCHPDLGIGGAERLVVDAAMELKSRGHEVHVFTAHHDHQHCFEETLGGYFPVTVYGDFLPRNICNKLNALCAYVRCLYVAFCMVLFWPTFDVILVDQVSVVIPVLKLKRSKILFYCHFPDLLLAQHTTLLRKLYRAPIDKLEEITTGKADIILVNSQFTASTFKTTFTNLHLRGIHPFVLYPAIEIQQFHSNYHKPIDQKLQSNPINWPFFLSINRFERKKNVGLAISAFALAVKQYKEKDTCHENPDSEWENVKLVIAGGYDVRLTENREYLQELKALAHEEGISDHVLFEPSCSTAKKSALLSSCISVIYTPTGEHFGIVPLEAMASKKPVIACNSGGPRESIMDTVTGFLCEPSGSSFSAAILLLLQEPDIAKKMGLAARMHVEQNFSRQVFGMRLDSIISDLVDSCTAKQHDL